MKMQPPLNGAVLWEGPSALDGTPIAVIVTGIIRPSANVKADLLQTWIIPQHVSPVVAVRTGADRAVCGDCKHRKGTCYVVVGQAPQTVWRTYSAGKYPRATTDTWRRLRGRGVRFGAWGDPAAAPVEVWRNLAEVCGSWTGYTHQWHRFPELKRYAMASCDSLDNLIEARSKGWRTFRVRDIDASGPEPMEPGEVMCPASAESSMPSSCSRCGLCAGASKVAKDVAIINHGRKHTRHLRRYLSVL